MKFQALFLTPLMLFGSTTANFPPVAKRTGYLSCTKYGHWMKDELERSQGGHWHSGQLERFCLFHPEVLKSNLTKEQQIDLVLDSVEFKTCQLDRNY
jgi:hypothetical protein